MHRKEQLVQKDIVRYLLLKGFLFEAPDCGVNVKSIRTRSILKQMGRMSGVSDLIVWIPGGTLCIEVKRPVSYRYSQRTGKQVIADRGGVQSDNQKDFEDRVNKIPGHHYIVVNDVLQVADYIKKNGITPS